MTMKQYTIHKEKCSCGCNLKVTCECESGPQSPCCCKRCPPPSDDCVEKEPYCCGDPIPLNRPEYPEAPGWNEGDKPKESPFVPGQSGEDKFKAFDKAVFDIIRSSGSPKGPRLGKRKNEYLPFLVIRASQGDHGTRPFNGVFWESPDIFVAPDIAADVAPDQPTTLGGIAKAGAPNTLWAHVWNLGHSPVYNARVEFYWCNPSLGINANSANLIGVTHTDLGDRYSGKSHKIVKCPQTWTPSFVNNGHECLIVRVFEPLLDSLPGNQWDVTKDRHIGQRNIAVVNAASPAHLEIMLKTGCNVPQGEADIRIEKVNLGDVSWLSLLKGKREHGYKEPSNPDVVIGIMQPSSVSKKGYAPSFKDVQPAAVKPLLKNEIRYERTCEEKESFFYMHVNNLKAGECVVYRIKQIVNGRVTGGYTLIVKKE
jgi:hypothetical protein